MFKDADTKIIMFTYSICCCQGYVVLRRLGNNGCTAVNCHSHGLCRLQFQRQYIALEGHYKLRQLTSDTFNDHQNVVCYPEVWKTLTF